MHKQNYIHRAMVSPTAIFKYPMEVVEANGIQLVREGGYSTGLGGR